MMGRKTTGDATSRTPPNSIPLSRTGSPRQFYVDSRDQQIGRLVSPVVYDSAPTRGVGRLRSRLAFLRGRVG